MSPSIGPVGSGCGLSNQFIDYLPYDLATLAGYGWQFALGRVDDIQPAVYNTEDGSPPSDRQPEGMILTPVVIGVETVLRGVAQPGAVRVLVEGGTIGCYTIRVDQAPRVAKGERAVFVLSPARNADGKPLGGVKPKGAIEKALAARAH